MMKKLILTLALMMFGALPAYAAPDRYKFDKDHTHIIFFISHVGFSHTIGRIKSFDGYFTFDEKNPTASHIDVTLEPGSVDTSVPDLDKVLVGPKFFNTNAFPTMHFVSTSIQITGKNTGDVTGNFTLHGVTKPVVLHVIYNRSGIHPFTNNYVSGFSADALIKRSDFGMGSYIPVVGDEVKIHLEVEGVDPLKHPGNAAKLH